jgi:hypothetical protein
MKGIIFVKARPLASQFSLSPSLSSSGRREGEGTKEKRKERRRDP